MVQHSLAEGGTELRELFPTDENEIEELLATGFAIEDRSWKGAAGTSVLKNPHVYQFYLDQAKQLARDGQLELVFLNFQGQPIAFE